MRRIAMTEQEAIESINPARVQIVAQEAFIVARATRVEQPVRASIAQVHGRAGSGIKHSNFRLRARRPVWPFHVDVTGR